MPDDRGRDRRRRCDALSAAYDHVFTSGGIGPTHDDITADCVAEAFGVTIDVRDDARALLERALRRTGDRAERGPPADGPHPRGRELIENPVSRGAGLHARQRARDGRRAGGVPRDGRLGAADT